MWAQKFKRVAATALFQLHDEDSWLFYSPCNTISLVLKLHEKKAMESRYRRLERETKTRCTLLRLVSQLSKLLGLVRLILSDIWKFKRCLCITSTKYRESEGVQRVASRRYLSVKGDKNSNSNQPAWTNKITLWAPGFWFGKWTKLQTRRMASREAVPPGLWLTVSKGDLSVNLCEL